MGIDLLEKEFFKCQSDFLVFGIPDKGQVSGG